MLFCGFCPKYGSVTQVLWRLVHVHSGVRHGTLDPDRVCPGQGKEDYSSSESQTWLARRRGGTASDGSSAEIQEAALSDWEW